MNRRFPGLVFCCALFALPFIIEAADATKPRVPWTNTRLVGTPETPPPFRATPAYPQLKPKQPIAAMRDPGAN